MNSFVFCRAIFFQICFYVSISHEFPVIVSSLFLIPSSMRFRAKFFGDEAAF